MSEAGAETLGRIKVGGIDVLVAAYAFQGIERYLGAAPTGATGANGADFVNLPLADGSNYRITAETRFHNSENRQVVFFSAFHEGREKIEWFIGPDSLQLFIDYADDFAADAVLPDVETGEGQPSVLRPASLTLQGVQFHYLVEQIPYTEGTPINYLIETGPFLLAPNVVYDAYRNPRVVYYIAYHKASGIPGYFVGPDSVRRFYCQRPLMECSWGIHLYFRLSGRASDRSRAGLGRASGRGRC